MKPPQAPPTRRRWPWISVLALLGVTAVLGYGCSSLSKAELESQLLALEKNTAVRTHGLERRALELRAGETPYDLDLVYLHVKPADDASVARTTPVVLIHGTPATLCTWSETIFGGMDFDGLAENREVYALEILGHGVAPGHIEPLTFQTCADFLNAGLDALGLESVHLVGNSYGGEFAWRAALDRPERIASLTLIHASGYERRPEDWLSEEIEMRENGLADWGYLINSRSRVESALQPHFQVIPPERTEEFFLVCENRVNWRAMVDLARDENGQRASELPEIQAPTLVLWGEREMAYPLDVYGRRFVEDIPGARLEVLEGASHYPHEEFPARTIQALEAFFDEQELP